MKRIIVSLILAVTFTTAFAYDAVVDGIYYNLDNTAMTAEVTESGTGYYAGTINIPSSINYNSQDYTVVSIGKKAFYQNTTLTSVTIPETVTRICDFAFNTCEGLTSISLPSGIDSIGNYAFAHSGITHSIICGDMFAYMPESFSGKYTLPDTISKICGAAFTTCTGLTGITLPDGLEYIGYSAFGSCSSLSSVVVPNSVTYLGEYAFNECFSLQNVKLPENLTSIEMCLFYSCTSLTSIEIPSTVQSVGRFAFCYCPLLSNVKCYATTPPPAGQYAFDQIAEDSKLYVPSGSLSAYKKAAEWKTFSNIYEMGGVSVDNACQDDIQVIASCGNILIHGAQGLSIALYSADGKMVTTISDAAEVQNIAINGSGIYFLRLSNGTTQRIVVR